MKDIVITVIVGFSGSLLGLIGALASMRLSNRAQNQRTLQELESRDCWKRKDLKHERLEALHTEVYQWHKNTSSLYMLTYTCFTN